MLHCIAIIFSMKKSNQGLCSLSYAFQLISMQNRRECLFELSLSILVILIVTLRSLSVAKADDGLRLRRIKPSSNEW